ncbi:MAG: DUF3352 domain-containing protein [Synechococcales cyanobacterium T60_A2020_003]|nr:DUF3352 domain-containing protein [Synechococcales cyanobacterium T60_A2020_003]
MSVGIGGFYLLVLRDPAMRLQQPVESVPSALMFIPQRAPFVFALQANPENIEAFKQTGLTADERRSLHQSFLQFKQNLLEGTGIRYTQDIRPWLDDEITAAIVSEDFDQNSANGKQPGYLLALSIQDLPRAQEFLQLFWEKRVLSGMNPQMEQYAGVKITADDSVATARFGDRFVLVSNSAKVLRQALNTVQVPEYGISHREAVMNAMRQLPTDRIGMLYVSEDKIQEFLSLDQNTSPDSTDDGFVAAIALNDHGIRLEGQDITSTPPTASGAVQPTASEFASLESIMRYVPSRSAVVLFGFDSQQLFNSVSSFPQRLIDSRLEPWRKRWQALFMNEGAAPVSGSYALVLLENQPKPEWIFVSHPVDDAVVSATEPSDWITALDEAGRAEGLNVVTLPLGDRSITAWTRIESNIVPLPNRKPSSAVTEDVVFDAEVEGVYTIIDQVLLVASSPEAMNAALNADSLYTVGGMQQSLEGLSSTSTDYLYFDGRSLQSMLEERLGLDTALARTQPLSGAIQSLTLSSDRPSRKTGFIQLQSS